jgi:hypothetical protein
MLYFNLLSERLNGGFRLDVVSTRSGGTASLELRRGRGAWAAFCSPDREQGSIAIMSPVQMDKNRHVTTF